MKKKFIYMSIATFAITQSAIVQKTAIVYHLQRIKVSIAQRLKVNHLQRVKVNH